jgi:hypothetical protein
VVGLVVIVVVVVGEVVAVVVGELVAVVVRDVVAVDVIVVISQSLKVPSTNESMARFSTATTCLQSVPVFAFKMPLIVQSTVATMVSREYSVTILLSAVAIDVQLCADTSDGAPPMSAPQETSVRFSVQTSRRSLTIRA